MAGKKPVLGTDTRIERQLGDPVRDQIQIGRFLGVLGKQLEEAGVVYRVIVIVTGMYVERMLGHGPGRDVEHVREALPDRGVE